MLAPGVSYEAARSRYRQLVKQHHPDCVSDSTAKEQADARLKHLNAAYEAIEAHFQHEHTDPGKCDCSKNSDERSATEHRSAANKSAGSATQTTAQQRPVAAPGPTKTGNGQSARTTGTKNAVNSYRDEQAAHRFMADEARAIWSSRLASTQPQTNSNNSDTKTAPRPNDFLLRKLYKTDGNGST